MRLLLALLLAAPPASLAQPSADVPVQRVILFTSGVGYFEHEGTVRGDAALTLRFEQSALDDVIKSLVVEDRRGRVSEVVYPSQAPLERRLRSFAVDLSQSVTIGSVLSQLRGAQVVVETGQGTFRGAILGVDRPADEESAVGSVLSLLTPTGIRTVRLGDARRVEIVDAALRAEVEGALAALAEGTSGDRKPVTVRFEGGGTRPVRLGYVVESPVWKTTYRLILPEEGDADGTLQGWAVVENPTESDWDDVRLDLVSGRPISFEMDLYTPRYLARPRVALPDEAAFVQPRAYAEGASTRSRRDALPQPAPPPPASAPRVGYERPVFGEAAAVYDAELDDAGIDLASGVQAQAAAGEVGELFAYSLGSVTLPRRGSAMIPIVTDPVRVDRVSIYTPGTSGRHPLRGARLTNTTGKHLRGGPITVFDDGYSGDALLADLPPGDDRLVSFALDQDVLVDTVPERTRSGTLQSAVIRDGVLVIRRERARTSGYRLENRGDRDRSVLIEHPRLPGGRLTDGLAAEETAPGLYRIRVELGAGETDTLRVREAADLGESIRLSDRGPEQILAIVQSNAGLPADVRRALQRAAESAREVNRARERLSALQQEKNEISREQERIRGNLQSVDNTTDYAQRLLRKLDDQETRLERLDGEIDEAQRDVQQRQAAFRRLVESLDVGT